MEFERRYMSPNEAATVFGVTPQAIREWCRNGRFEGAKQMNGDRGRWLIPISEVIGDAA